MQPLSILCRSLRDIDTYTTGFPRGTNQGQPNIFRAVKRVIPGPVRIPSYSPCRLVLQFVLDYYTSNLVILIICSTPLFYLQPSNFPNNALGMVLPQGMQKGDRLASEFQMIPSARQYCKIWMNLWSAQGLYYNSSLLLLLLPVPTCGQVGLWCIRS